MNLEAIKQKALFQLTAKEFLFLQRHASEIKINQKDSRTKTTSKKYVYGLRGIANLIGGSISSANRLKKSGVIKDAIIQNGRKIIVDSELALELIKKSKEQHS